MLRTALCRQQGISRAGTLIPPSHRIQVNPKAVCCVEVGMQEWWHPLGFRSHPKGHYHGNAGVPRANRHCTDTPSHHKMKEFVFILFFQVRDNYVFFQK